MSFIDLRLDEKIQQSIDKAGYTEPTEIQKQAIPVVMEGNDLMASAQTGTGKTAAFVLPALQRLLTVPPQKARAPRVLVLTPTRELAMQVSENIRLFGRFTKISSGSVVGGMPYPPQIRMLKQGVDIIIATPGRLMDHMQAGYVDLSNIELLVLDEADRMLDMGFIDDVKIIAEKTPATRQTLLFSATLHRGILNVTRDLLKNPKTIEISSQSVKHESIAQHIHQADDYDHKHKLLAHCLEQDGVEQTVIFTSTKRGAEELADILKAQGRDAAALHGDMRQNARKRTVEMMRRGRYKVLVATDVAARGLDIKGVSHVINFDLPMVAEDYVHRIGRTGRGGAKGIAISFVGPDDRHKLRGIERFTGQKLERTTIPGLEPKRVFDKPRFENEGRGGGGGRGGNNGGKRRFGEGRPRTGNSPSRFGEGRSDSRPSRFGEGRPDSRPSRAGEGRSDSRPSRFGEGRPDSRPSRENRGGAGVREGRDFREGRPPREGSGPREDRGSREGHAPQRADRGSREGFARREERGNREGRGPREEHGNREGRFERRPGSFSKSRAPSNRGEKRTVENN